MKPDPDSDRLRGHYFLHGERRLTGHERVPFLCARSTKNRLQTVAKPAEDCPVEPPDRLGHGLDYGSESTDRFLRIEAGDHFS